MIKRLLASALLLTLAACTTNPSKPTAPVTDWQLFTERQQQLTQWELYGKLGIKSPHQKSGSAKLKWVQQEQQYAVRLSGLGIPTTYIDGDSQGVTMRSDDQHRAAASSEELTWQLLGVPLSVEDLTYWVRGIPTPNKSILERTHDNNGALQTLTQNGWQLQFSRYKEAEEWLLPGIIEGQRGEVSFKLLIKNWKPMI